MKQILSIALCFLLFGALPLCAEDTTGASTGPLPNVISTEVKEEAKTEVVADKMKIAEEKAQIKANAKVGRIEERDLHKQIQAAQKAGDTQKAGELRSQMKTMHQENVAQMKQDKNELKTAKKELRADRKAVVKNRKDLNKDGAVDPVEKTKAKKRGWWGL